MRLHINGQWKELPDAQTVADVLHHFQLADRMVVVELNLEIVPRDQYGLQAVRDGDHMEIVHFVGGG